MIPLLEAVSPVAPVAGVIKAAFMTEAGEGVPGGAARAGRGRAAPPVGVAVPRRAGRLTDA